jgi:hypothetical protein
MKNSFIANLIKKEDLFFNKKKRLEYFDNNRIKKF